ncbi:enoyl-CoA hydratase [Nocardioides sp. AE5]|uniref:enoyl-CoA hydratase n=1 Tax=Nocardioides sp. AE5 TaxID=2962573 RepID=UPI0028810644|nr:enoyl-CoA hydratase [Nocardioides sp. AE5]MDT0203178.1 enoyl-CoA hydratase [Nocardioides sp. AE5]
MSTIPLITYETPRPGVARIELARPEARNAQSSELLYQLNDGFDRAAADDTVRAVVLTASGPHFSAGHDLTETTMDETFDRRPRVGTWCGHHLPGAEGVLAKESEIYLGFSERWRNLPKPTIAAVQGKAIAGGLMLAWPCDLIVASDDAEFIDNTVDMGVAGAEFFNHPWELPPRIAKEMLFTSGALTAEQAHRFGMVNHVVPRQDLIQVTLDLAERIATKPSLALRLAKASVNAAQDAQGRSSAMQTAFANHQLCHSHNQQLFGLPIDPSFTLARK